MTGMTKNLSFPFSFKLRALYMLGKCSIMELTLNFV